MSDLHGAMDGVRLLYRCCWIHYYKTIHGIVRHHWPGAGIDQLVPRRATMRRSGGGCVIMGLVECSVLHGWVETVPLHLIHSEPHCHNFFLWTSVAPVCRPSTDTPVMPALRRRFALLPFCSVGMSRNTNVLKQTDVD